jgi:hypothetical protein
MRAAPVSWTDADGISYAHVDYARLVKAQGAVVVVGDAEEDETARQKVNAPDGLVVLGLGANASATKSARAVLAEQGVRVISTVGGRSDVEPFPSPELAYSQAIAFSVPQVREAATRRLYAGRFVDSPLVNRSPVDRLVSLDAELIEETYTKYRARFKVARFVRHPAGTDKTNKALTAVEERTLETATDVTRLLGLSPTLGLIASDSNRAFAQDLVDALRLDVVIPIGFLVGAQKLDSAGAADVIDEQLHYHRIIPKMIAIAHQVFAI